MPVMMLRVVPEGLAAASAGVEALTARLAAAHIQAATAMSTYQAVSSKAVASTPWTAPAPLYMARLFRARPKRFELPTF
jgi:PPE-repeat protein